MDLGFLLDDDDVVFFLDDGAFFLPCDLKARTDCFLDAAACGDPIL